MTEPLASCFISYNHADKALAQALADGLAEHGYFVWIDEGRLRIGDSLIEAISSAIGQVDFLVALVSATSVSSNWCQKEVSLAMTGEIYRKGITVLPCRVGQVQMPLALADKLYLEVDPADPAGAVDRLVRAMTQHLAPAQPIPPRRRSRQNPSRRAHRGAPDSYNPDVEIRMTGIDSNAITMPRNDGTRGSALYRVPISLSHTPDQLWAELFVHHFDHPTRWTTMHRPGIVSISGDRILLDGTTMDEVERYHLDTLKLAVAAANNDRLQAAARETFARDQAAAARQAHERETRSIADRLNFD